jgi:hypothetical protein
MKEKIEAAIKLGLRGIILKDPKNLGTELGRLDIDI